MNNCPICKTPDLIITVETAKDYWRTGCNECGLSTTPHRDPLLAKNAWDCAFFEQDLIQVRFRFTREQGRWPRWEDTPYDLVIMDAERLRMLAELPFVYEIRWNYIESNQGHYIRNIANGRTDVTSYFNGIKATASADWYNKHIGG